MQRIFETLLLWSVSFALWFRYRIRVKGLDRLNKETLTRKGGVLFLPNHPAMGVDPLSIVSQIWKRFPVRPLIVEYMFYAPGIYGIMKRINGIPVPNNEVSSNSIKKIRSDKALEEVVHGLKRGENFLLYPSGRLKDTGYEFIGGASGAHRIISQNPEINIVLVRTVGFWGSSFTKAYTGKSPPFFPTLWKGVKASFKNLLIFNPRRTITIEFMPAPEDFPRYGSRVEINRYLEKWYDREEGLRPKGSTVIGEPLSRVSYSLWSNQVLEPTPPLIEEDDPEINLEKIPQETKMKIIQKLSEMTNIPSTKIKENMVIASDLSLDSLDMAELVLFLDDEFDVKGVPVIELTTVKRCMAIAARQVAVNEEEEVHHDLSSWKEKSGDARITLAEGATIPEAFLNNAERMGKRIAMGDDRSGIMNYKRVKIGVILLAELIRKLPGKHIGIMLPASAGASLAILATELAGKVPVMINWTVGTRHLNAVVEAAGIERIISSWAFIDRLGNVDLGAIDDELIMLEDMRRDIGLGMKIKALLLSKKKTPAILKHFGADTIKPNDPAVVLFTSGTEGAPKGVPLSNKNLLCNVRSVFESVPIFENDIFLSVLPPFHSFGLTAGVYLGLLSGLRMAYYPNPTNGAGVAKAVEKWRATIICGAPTFLKGMLKAGEKSQFQTLRFVVSGAERAPPELYALLEAAGLHDILKEGYGITETSPVLTINRPGVEPKGVGQAVEGVELLLVHPETHEPVKTGEEGLILAAGDNVFAGYLNKMQASPFLTIKNRKWYNTGDLGFLDELGRLTISGRLKRFLKVGGEMISLGAIEEALLHMAPKKGWQLAEEGSSLAVLGKENPDQKPDIVVITRFPAKLDELNQAAREAGLSNLVKITSAHYIDEIPLMGSGKTNYRALESKYLV